MGGLAAAAGLVLLAAPALAATVPGTIVDNAFQPRNFTVAAGDTLVFTNTGQRQHTVTADDGSFNSGPLNNGQTFSRTFTTPGTFAYFCAFHGGPNGQGQSGVITVTAAQVTTTTTTAAPTTTTTVAPTTTTTAAAATTTTAASAQPAPTTSTTIRPAPPTTAVARAVGTAAPPAQLPRTGSSSTLALVLIGTGLVLMGVGTVRGTRTTG
ncbi:MAG: cupredoxin domain-containing protein [Acidimicrobiales bacterium]